MSGNFQYTTEASGFTEFVARFAGQATPIPLPPGGGAASLKLK